MRIFANCAVQPIYNIIVYHFNLQLVLQVSNFKADKIGKYLTIFIGYKFMKRLLITAI